MGHQDRWIVVGGGASGLAAAYFLEQRGLRSVIVERDGALGGRMGTVQLGDRTLDCGGKNIGRRYRLFREFVAALGSHPFEYFGLNSSQVIDGRVTTFDGTARWRTMADLARGLSPKDVVRFARLLWQVKRDEATGYLGSAHARDLARRYDDAPASRYFSAEFCRRILRPMSVRMNGAEPDEVFVGNLTSNVRMILDTYEQLANGLGPVLSACLARYDVRLHTATEGLVVENGRVAGVRIRLADGSAEELRGAGVIVATPASITATLAEPVLPAVARGLRAIAYYPVSLVIAEYEKPVFSHGTRAFVFDNEEAVSNAGAYGVNDLHLVRYTFSGRTSRHFASDFTDPEALLRMGEAALSRHVRFDGNRRRRFVARRFSPGLCAYAPHHAQLMDRIRQELGRLGGLHLTGDYVQGASIEACFRSASACVSQLAGETEISRRSVTWSPASETRIPASLTWSPASETRTPASATWSPASAGHGSPSVPAQQATTLGDELARQSASGPF
jgi:oxygen-dependent protoporphyrinogen oxidase